MGLRDNLRAFSERWVAEQTRAITPAMFGKDIDWDTSAAAVRVDRERAMRLSAHWRCISLLVGDISTQPMDVVRTEGRRRIREERPAWMTRPTNNPNDTFDQLMADAVFSLLTDGNIFVLGLPSIETAQYLEVWDPSKTDLVGDEFVQTTTRRKVGPDQMLHIPWVRLPGRRRGLNPIEAAREGLGIGLASMEYGNRYFSNGTTMSGVIEHPGTPTKDELELLRDSFKKNHQGLRNSHAFGVLTGGAKWQQMSASPKDAMLVELWEWVVEDTARFYGIPPWKLGSTKPGAVAYASTSNARIEYVQSACLPLTRKIESGFSRLTPGRGFRIDLNGLMRGDQEARFRAYAAGLQNRFITVDEVRAWEDWTPAAEADGIGTADGGFVNTPNNTTGGAAAQAI